MAEEATNPVADEELDAPTLETGVVDEADQAQGDDEGSDEDAPEDEGQAAPETEEIELNGKKYAVPKDLKDGYLRQSDYTKKTQEVAETRREVEARREAVSREAELVGALREDYGQVHALKAHVEQYKNVDWNTLNAQDPSSGQAHWMQFQMAKDALADAERSVGAKEAELRASRERETANARARTLQTLQTEIPDFNPQKAQSLADFARDEFGVRPEELGQADARTWKMLSRLHAAEVKLKASESKQTAAQRQAKVEAVTPAVSVKGKAPADNRLRDTDDPDAWAKKFLAQRAKRG